MPVFRLNGKKLQCSGVLPGKHPYAMEHELQARCQQQLLFTWPSGTPPPLFYKYTTFGSWMRQSIAYSPETNMYTINAFSDC